MTATTDTRVRTDGDTVRVRSTVKLPVLRLDEVAKPLFAYVGVADYALEQAKELPARVSSTLETVPGVVKTLPAQVKDLRDEVGNKATVLYSSLAIRGERLVTQIRRQPATEAAIAEGKEAVRKAEAAAIAARNALRAGERALEGAAAKLG